MIFTVTNEFDGKVLREFLRIKCAVSRKTLCKLKTLENGILLNGNRVTVRATVRVGDTVSIAVEDCESDENPYVKATGKMPQIVYEDDAVIAVNKPAGMPTHTSFGHYEDALSNSVCGYFSGKGIPFVFRAINRLDRDTSGIVLIAKNKYYASILSKSLKNGEFEKKYIALTEGEISDSGKIEGYIAREGESIIKRRFSAEEIEGGEYSVTEYKVFSRSKDKSLVIVRPITGRTHQIRVHLASIGASIVGDTMYGKSSELICRQALHAYSLSFPSPITKERMTVVAPLSSDIKAVADKYCLDLPMELE